MALAFDANLGNVTNSASLTTSAAAASGSRVFLFVLWDDATATLTGVSGGGLTWVVDHQYAGTNGNENMGIASADAPSGLASSTSLTPSFSAVVDFGPGMAAASFTGVATGASGYVDTTAAGKNDFNEAWTTNNLVTTLADTLLFGLSGSSSNETNTAAANYTEIHDWTWEGSNTACTVYRIVSSAGTYTPGGTWTGSVFYQFNIGIAYEADAGEPPPPGPKLRSPVMSGSRMGW